MYLLLPYECRSLRDRGLLLINKHRFINKHQLLLKSDPPLEPPNLLDPEQVMLMCVF